MSSCVSIENVLSLPYFKCTVSFHFYFCTDLMFFFLCTAFKTGGQEEEDGEEDSAQTVSSVDTDLLSILLLL